MFIRNFGKDNNRRGAIIILCAQAEGTNTKKIRISAAYHEISVARYRGEGSRNFTLDDYTGKQANAYAKLLDLKDVIPESKKVGNFLKGVLDPRLKTAKENVLGDAGKHDDFNVTQYYLRPVCSSMAEQDKSDLLILAIEREEGG